MTKFKEKISWYKLLFTATLTALYGTIGWFFLNYNNTDLEHLILNISCSLVFICILVISMYKIRFYINCLEGNKNDCNR